MPDEYRERVVAFVDILGFSSLVYDADQDVELRRKILHALRQVSVLRGPIEGDTSFRAQSFSDCLILTADNTAAGLWRILFAISDLTWHLLDIGVLLRGGVTIGNVLHDDEIVFGVGINRAYHLENKLADMPRVLLDDKVMEACGAYAENDEVAAVYLNARVLKDTDGHHFLNFLLNVSLFNQSGNPADLSLRAHELFVDGTRIRDELQKMLDESLGDPRVYRKVRWIAELWNDRVARPFEDGRHPLIGSVILHGPRQRHVDLAARPAQLPAVFRAFRPKIITSPWARFCALFRLQRG
ncbi:hypothetical protein HFO38_15700 [Rhizobium leguminosarum]|uniref:hypothetical protein n=1 Tax=Rhizobium leguminosarum TaxID=384 RepID=UPI001C93BF76|nr:hypothetical protein [Rhizobium leguminosarum]MBY5704152.1 hypothetical protein [Rhizobium leguminosarum]